MFSKYKKPSVPKDVAGKPSINIAQPAKSNAPSEEARQPLMKAMKPRSGADTGTMDKEKRRKERLGEIKLELHKALLDNLNLAALESASEPELRAEINAIANESLEEMGIGRPSTYASIIDTIQAREYVFKKGNALVPSWTAFSVVRLLEQQAEAGLIVWNITTRLDTSDAPRQSSRPHCV